MPLTPIEPSNVATTQCFDSFFRVFTRLLAVKFDELISLGKVACYETGDLLADYIMCCCDKVNWNFERLETTNLHTKGRDVTVRNGNENNETSLEKLTINSQYRG